MHGIGHSYGVPGILDCHMFVNEFQLFFNYIHGSNVDLLFGGNLPQNDILLYTAPKFSLIQREIEK